MVADDGLWFVGHDALDESVPATIDHFSLDEGAIDASVDPPMSPIAMAAAHDAIWVLNYEGSVTRINVR